MADAPDRRALLAKIHVGRKKLGLDEDDYRAMLERLVGHRSAADCSRIELVEIGSEFDRLLRGALCRKPIRGAHAMQAASPIARKARALWISLHQLGAIVDPSERALETFGRRQLGVDRLHWANPREGYRLIEALKAMAERAGWCQQVDAALSSREQVRVLKERLLSAIVARLAVADPAAARGAPDPAGLKPAELDAAIRSLAHDLSGALAS